MRFAPYLVNGKPAQIISRITMSFKAARLGGPEK
jgi:hypothetical protein